MHFKIECHLHGWKNKSVFPQGGGGGGTFKAKRVASIRKNFSWTDAPWMCLKPVKKLFWNKSSKKSPCQIG